MADEQQKQVLQYLLYKSLISIKDLENVYATVYESMTLTICSFSLISLTFQTNICFSLLICFIGQGRGDEIRNLVKSLNDLLKPAQLAVKSRLCEDSNEEYFALINLIESEAAKYVFSKT